MWSDDPVRDADNYTYQQEQRLKMRPVCIICKYHIQDDGCYDTDDGPVCRDCITDYNQRFWKSL